jgi:predicted DNA-binding WGR domain protein
MTDKKSNQAYLELSDGTSHKFYEITVKDNRLMIRFGRIGTQGHSNVEEYDTPEKARKEANKRVLKKKKKGYQEAKEGKKPKKKLTKKPRITFEDQLKNLAECGISLYPHVSPDILLTLYERKDYERRPYKTLLVALGGQIGESNPRNISPNIWHFDTECIYEDESYVEIANRLKELAGDAFPIQNITASVDFEAVKAWIDFELHGETYHWDIKVEDDWVDPYILCKFDEKLIATTKLRYTYLDLGGQDCLIGCCTAEQLQKLKEITGLKFQWACEY